MVSLEKEDGEFKYWLLRVCKNSWLDGLKKKKYILDKPYDEALSLTGNDMVSFILKEEERRTLYEVILYLPQTYKEYIILYYFCNLSLKEISEIMNISPGAGRMLISRARKYLKERLNKEDFI